LQWYQHFADEKGKVLIDIVRSAQMAGPFSHAYSYTAGAGHARTPRVFRRYNQTRTEYYRQLDRASTSGGDIVPFVEYAARGFVDGLREQLDKIRDQQWDVLWRSYVHEKFRDPAGVNAKRQRDLVLELSAAREPVAVGKIAELTPRLAKTYAGISAKTLQRDLAAVEELGLIERKAEGVRAKRELILAFLPWRRTNIKGQAANSPAPKEKP
jgi:hypothetical protein